MTHKRFTIILLAGLLTLLTVAAMPAQAQAAAWKVSYYNNLFLSDPPALDTTATQITFDWGGGSPAGAVRRNNWSARYGTDVFFTAATYRFTVRADDEVRLWIDNKSVLNTFDAGQPNTTLTVDVALNGTHHLQVDYRERTGNANLNVTWQDVRTIGLTPTPGVIVPTGVTATVVNAYVLNVRNAPSVSGAVVTKIARNQVYSVLGKNADATWYKLDVNGQQGWSSAAYLLVSNPFAIAVIDGTPVTTVGTTVVSYDVIVRTPVRLNFRTGPATNFSSSEILPAGALLKVIGRNGDSSWLKVDYEGRQGWVALVFVQSVTPINFMTIPVVG